MLHSERFRISDDHGAAKCRVISRQTNQTQRLRAHFFGKGYSKGNAMNRVILAVIAASSLSLPALAQQNSSTQSPSPSASSQTQSNEMISPDKLKSAQIHQIQQSLNDKGFSVGTVDGEWGPRTEDALKKFQGSKNMPSSGQLNANTVTALGLNSSDFPMSGTGSETTGQAPAGNSKQPSSNSEPNKGTSSDQPH
jgi:peptidoglycan hydrolase-like protein with peptidoglycan-binding domain